MVCNYIHVYMPCQLQVGSFRGLQTNYAVWIGSTKTMKCVVLDNFQLYVQYTHIHSQVYLPMYVRTCTHTYLHAHIRIYIICTYTVYMYIRIIHVYTVHTYVRMYVHCICVHTYNTCVHSTYLHMYVRTYICKYVCRHRVKILHIHMHAATNTLVPLSSQFDHCPLSVMDE